MCSKIYVYKKTKTTYKSEYGVDAKQIDDQQALNLEWTT
jgi:hypothetical protein